MIQSQFDVDGCEDVSFRRCYHVIGTVTDPKKKFFVIGKNARHTEIVNPDLYYGGQNPANKASEVTIMTEAVDDQGERTTIALGGRKNLLPGRLENLGDGALGCAGFSTLPAVNIIGASNRLESSVWVKDGVEVTRLTLMGGPCYSLKVMSEPPPGAELCLKRTCDIAVDEVPHLFAVHMISSAPGSGPSPMRVRLWAKYYAEPDAVEKACLVDEEPRRQTLLLPVNDSSSGEAELRIYPEPAGQGGREVLITDTLLTNGVVFPGAVPNPALTTRIARPGLFRAPHFSGLSFSFLAETGREPRHTYWHFSDPPEDGEYHVCDVHSTEPLALGFMGWVCTDHSPLTWKKFGRLED